MNCGGRPTITSILMLYGAELTESQSLARLGSGLGTCLFGEGEHVPDSKHPIMRYTCDSADDLQR
jgi:hypothetical protein